MTQTRHLESSEPKLIGEILLPPPSVEQVANEPAADERQARLTKFNVLCAQRGSRYRECRLSNFNISNERQKAAVDALRAYGENIDEHLKMGDGIVLYGPRGTGKDHLLWAMVRYAVVAGGKFVRWVNGVDLYGNFRDAINDETNEATMIRSFIRPDILAISDPVPPSGKLTEFQQSQLFRIIDGRYSERKATWATVNVKDGQELDDRMGGQLADRLRDGALAIACEWPSYRKAR